MIYSGPTDQDFLLQILGLVLFRAGGRQVFTVDEINEINAFVGRIQVIAASSGNSLTVQLTSKGGEHEDRERQQPGTPPESIKTSGDDYPVDRDQSKTSA